MLAEKRREFVITAVVSLVFLLATILLVSQLGLGPGLIGLYAVIIGLVAVQSALTVWEGAVTLKAETSGKGPRD